MDVKIYKPCKSVMQSGNAGKSDWVIEYCERGNDTVEPLMGWTQSDSTLDQVRVKFKTCDTAVAYAASKGWDYTIQPENERKVKPKNYVDNFKYIPQDSGN